MIEQARLIADAQRTAFRRQRETEEQTYIRIQTDGGCQDGTAYRALNAANWLLCTFKYDPTLEYVSQRIVSIRRIENICRNFN